MAYQPKSYKKFVATAATATLVASAVAPTALAADFTDVNANYKNAVDYLVDQGIANGLTETTFGVTSPIKRGDAAIMIAKALGLNTTTAPDAGFTDVNARVAGAVNAIVAAGIASGKTSTTFAPDLYITRQETAKIIANAYGLTGSGTTSFTDVNSNWAPFVSALEEAGIAQGLNETTFGATNDVTRGQFALFLYRAEGQPYEVATVESLMFNAEGNEFTLKFAEALPADADLNYVLENYEVLVNGAAPSQATVEALKLMIKSVSADRMTVVVSHTDLDELASALGGTSATLSIGGKSDTYTFEVNPKVNSISVVNAKELQITFNLPVKEASVIDGSDDLIAGVFNLNSTDARTLVDNAYLSADGKVLTLVANDGSIWNGSYAAELVKDKVEATNGKKVAEFKTFLTASDTTRPTFGGVSYEPSGAAKFTFSEPLNESEASLASKLVVSGPTAVSVLNTDITLADDKKSFVVALPAAMTKDASYTFTFTGLVDFAGNLTSPNPLSATVVKSDRDTVKPTVTNVAALDTGKLQVTFSEKVQSTGAVVTVDGANSTTYTLDSTGTVATFTGVTNLNAGVQTVTVSGAQDLAGNPLDSVTRVIQVSADTTAPAYVSHTVETVGSDRFLVVNYNEEVTVDNTKTLTGTYVNNNNITLTAPSITGTDITLGTDKKSARVKLPTTAGTYTYNLPAGLVQDTSTAMNDSAARTVSFTVGAAVDTSKPVVSTFNQVGNKVTVTFDRAVTAATALNVNNYSIDGVVSPFSSAIFKGNDQTVELTLKDDVITTNGVRNYTVANVATSAGSVMETTTATYDFDENVRPTVVSARLTSGTTVEVTLSEALNAATVGTDFDVFQGTSTTALAENSELISGTNKVVITLTTPLTSLTGLTVKASSTINLADTNGNVVNFVGPIAVTN